MGGWRGKFTRRGSLWWFPGKTNCLSTKNIMYSECLRDNWVVSGCICLEKKQSGSGATQTRVRRSAASSVIPRDSLSDRTSGLFNRQKSDQRQRKTNSAHTRASASLNYKYCWLIDFHLLGPVALRTSPTLLRSGEGAVFVLSHAFV